MTIPTDIRRIVQAHRIPGTRRFNMKRLLAIPQVRAFFIAELVKTARFFA